MGESERMYAVRHKSVDFDNLIIDLGSICFQWVLRFTEVYAQLLSNAINHQHSPRNSQIEKKEGDGSMRAENYSKSATLILLIHRLKRYKTKLQNGK